MTDSWLLRLEINKHFTRAMRFRSMARELGIRFKIYYRLVGKGGTVKTRVSSATRIIATRLWAVSKEWPDRLNT